MLDRAVGQAPIVVISWLCAALAGAPPDAPASPSASPRTPPRIDGTYVGATFGGSLALVRVNDLQTRGAFSGFSGTVRVGQMVLPWLGLGVQLAGAYAVRSETGSRQRMGEGALLIEGTFVPAPRKLDLSLHAGFGVGGGAVREAGVAERAGFGGAMFAAAIRYTWFPGARRRRPDRGGGFGLGPELGWLGATPAASGRPMSHVFSLSLAGVWYFGS